MVVSALFQLKQRFLEELVSDVPKTIYRSEKTPFQRSEADRFMMFLKSEQDRFFNEKPVYCNDADGLKLGYSDHSWLMIRPSGTENVIRILVESIDKKRADDLVNQGFNLIEYYR